MERYASLILCIGAMIMQPVLSYGFDYSGQWLGTITESINHCENLGKAEPGEYTLTITHKGNDIVVMENIVRRPYTGVFNPQRPQIAHVVGTYVDDGGFVAELVDIEFESDTTGNGKSVWRWSSGYYSCGGNFNFSLVKIRP